MKKLISALHLNKKLLPQFALVFLAFLIMVLIGSFFGTRIVNRNIASYGKEAMKSADETITAYLGEYKTTLDNVAFSTERLKSKGVGIDELQTDLASWTSWIMSRKEYESFLSIYCAIDGKVIDGQYVEPPEGYIPESRPWYIGALEKNGETHYCDPYVDVRTGEIILTVSKLMFDDNGEPFGVIAIDVFITSTADFVKSLSLLGSGYGLLLDSNRAIVIHPDSALVGMPFEDVNGGLGGYAEISGQLAIGNDVSAFPYTSYTGIESVAFLKRLFNGWYVGIISPSNAYFNDVYAMIAILSAVGFVLMVLLCVVLAYLHIEKNRSDEANKIKTSFLANMSHEIRTPMNAVIGMSELLLKEPLNNRQQGYVKDINVSSLSLLSIINDILDLSKIEAGKFELSPVDYDFHVFIDNIRSMFGFVTQKKNLEFKFELDGEMPKCLFGDDIRLRQVLTNICGNAVKFTSKGFLRLKVTVTDETIIFEIEDTGMGIHKDDLPKLFELFTQADTQRNRNIVGTGLGFPISKTFVEMMGGNISADSVYGKGTVFTVTIPKVIGDETAIGYDEKDQGSEVFFAPSAKILVVDDNEVNLKVARELLNLYKIDAKTVASGEEAVRIIKEMDFDIVFMDHMMPEMDGVETTKEIRKLGGKYKHMTIIALTANAVRGAKEMFLANSFADFLSKPIEILNLAQILREWLPSEKIEFPAEPFAQENGNINNKSHEDIKPPDRFLNCVNKISGINTEIGLSRVSGMEGMYRETLELFSRKLLPECEKMNGFLNSGDLHNLAISVHGMKSSLSTIGAMELSTTANELETASKDRQLDYCREHFPGFLEKLRSLHEQLSAIIPDMEITPVHPEGNIGYLRENVQKALDAADDFDEDAIAEAIRNLSGYDFGEQTNALLAAADIALKDFDFDAVTDCLNKIINK